MAEKKNFTPVSDLGEFGLIDHLTQDIQPTQKTNIKGVGDDAAVFACASDRVGLLTSDILVEGIHFDLSYSPLKHLGYKSVVVNLSDIYAMNGVPERITVAIAASSRFPVEAFDEIYEGIKLACSQYNVDLVGGDISASHKGLIISIAAYGTAATDKVVMRSTAREGDLICLSGDLGAAYLGLQILEREKRIFMENPDVQPDLEKYPYLIERQLKPEARKDIPAFFEKLEFLPSAMIDLSDGLASDLLHICHQSGLGAEIRENDIFIRQEAQMMALEFQLDPITCALSGGEDYELLFTIDPADQEKLAYMTDISVIGEMKAKEEGVKLRTMKDNFHDVTAQGWKHY